MPANGWNNSKMNFQMNIRILFLLLCCLSALPGFSQSAGKARDTLFLFRDTGENSRHRVYIAPDKTAAARKRLLDFSLSKLDTEILEANYAAALSDTPEQGSQCLPAAQKLYGLSREWLPVHQYKGRYYLYTPCDAGNSGKILIQPTRLLRFLMDGPGVDLLESISKVGPKTYRLVTYVCGPEDRDPDLFYIHLLNKSGQLAIWEHVGAPEGERYQLRVTPAGAVSLDLIVNECPDAKTAEWNGFEPVDFKKLLSPKR